MAKKEEVKMSKEEQIGFHKGSLATLAKERQELSRILQIVEQLMQMHVKALQELGVDLTKEMSPQEGEVDKAKPAAKKSAAKPKKPIEDLI
ncbi:hypothetical protein D6745_01490 [Candidatus Woesearchaeota archaeon]|nr:MAG: hypothetical protein D6745_01490 [Candidatus Woesearchaeota archaeon]